MLLITPSPDYAYLLGYQAPALERLTCLIVPADGEPALVLPRLEEPLARHQLGQLADEMTIVPWDETDDPIRLVEAIVVGAPGLPCRTRCGRAWRFACERPSTRPSWSLPVRR